MSTAMNLGTRRGLSQCASPDGTFCMLAIDHRQALVKAFSRYGDKAMQEGIKFKQEVVRALQPYSTAFLMDPVLGAGPAIAGNALSGATGLLVSVEESGYAGPAHARVSRLPANWNVEKIKRMGASAVKLLIYYHPDAETAEAMQALLAQVSQECTRCDIPFFLEILTYSPSQDGAALSDDLRRQAILRSVEELTPIGGDILKVEFPAGLGESRQVWGDACRSITQASCIPWVLLSAGVDCEDFLEQTAVACASGASGILAGRAIWKEALSLDGEERSAFLAGTARDRMRQLAELCALSARPYFYCYPPLTVSAEWQTEYPGF
ncbi:MAG: tagatose 1,6-diphosphate aldolase [Omnitrophica WOR_2 bacterium]